MTPRKFPHPIEIMGSAIARLEINVLRVAWKDDGHPSMDAWIFMNSGLPDMESFKQSQCSMVSRFQDESTFDKMLNPPFTSSIEFRGPGGNLPGL